MSEHEARAAAWGRDAGMAKITAMTWRVGAAGVAVAGLLTFALSHHADTSQASHGRTAIVIRPSHPSPPLVPAR